MKTLYVHIGTPKTGTTAIQNFCIVNRKILQKNGFCFPALKYRYIGKPGFKNGMFLTSRVYDPQNGRQPEEEKRRFEEGLSRIEALFQKYDNVILSDEGIWYHVRHGRESLWEELKEAGDRAGYTVKVIVYLRRQDHLLVSSYNQKIKRRGFMKTNNTLTWKEYSDKYNKHINPDYYKTLKCAADVLGRENIIARRYDRKHLKGGDSREDFLDVLGLSLTPDYVMDDVINNTRLSLNQCEIKRIINDLPGTTLWEDRYIQEILLQFSNLSENDYPCSVWSKSDAMGFMEKFREDNDKAAEEFIGDGKPLFEDKYPDSELWKKDNPYLIDDVIRYAAMSNLMLTRRIQQLEEAVQDMEQRIQKQQDDISNFNLFRDRVKHPVKTVFDKIKGEKNDPQD